MTKLSSLKATAFEGLDIYSDDFLTRLHAIDLAGQPTEVALTGMEKSSLRGRIRLIESVAHGKIDTTPKLVREKIISGNPGRMIQFQCETLGNIFSKKVIHTSTFLRRIYVG
jgi:hypothetical protein